MPGTQESLILQKLFPETTLTTFTLQMITNTCPALNSIIFYHIASKAVLIWVQQTGSESQFQLILVVCVQGLITPLSHL